MSIKGYFPILTWIRQYNRDSLVNDGIAAVIVTIMLIPQSLAYALLAGLPAHVGLYASILPLTVYAVFGSSRSLSVGPVAVASLMTASAVGGIAAEGSADYLNAAILLAVMSGLLLLLLGLLRFGFLSNFLSHPVVSGFISASGIIIALSQCKHVLGIQADGDNLLELGLSLLEGLAGYNLTTLAIGMGVMAFLFWSKTRLAAWLITLGLSGSTAGLVAKTAPIVTVVVTISLAYGFDLNAYDVALIGRIPAGLPTLSLPVFDSVLYKDLLVPAILISIIGYVESVSVGKTLGAKKRQRIDPDQELIGLGAANLASGLSGGFPVTGGFARSVVNFEAGAQTPAAGFFAAIGIALATLTLTDYLAFLPKATLAATIIVAVLGLVDLSVLKKTWNYSLSDFIAVSGTISITLLWGVEMGVLAGVLASIGLHLYKTARPHVAEVGEIAGTEHFRNVKRYEVVTHPSILSLRVDESLYFPNATYLEEKILGSVDKKQQLKHVILMCTAVNEIDISALEVLEEINLILKERHISFNLSEVKGPVMDALKRTDFFEHLNGKVYLSQHEAVTRLLAEDMSRIRSNPDYQDYQI